MFQGRAAFFAWVLTLISALMAGLFNSDVSKITFWVLLAVTVAFLDDPGLRSVIHAGTKSFLNFATALFSFISRLFTHSTKYSTARKFWKLQKLSIIPVSILIVFFLLYSFSDQEFADEINKAWNTITDWLSENLNITSIFLFLFGLWISSSIFIRKPYAFIANHEVKQNDFLFRQRKTKTHLANFSDWFMIKYGMMGLKNEYQRGIILFSMLNFLLLAVNVIDIWKVWLDGTQIMTPHARSIALHESTNTLIFSILLAIGILIFFFRRNINFLKKNQGLIQISYLWIFQNSILACTVAIRNYYYISDYGLTYKRIGVIVFLLLTLVGLLTLFLKIRNKRSFFYMYRINGWSVAIMMTLISCINWDPLIARYNFSHFAGSSLGKQFISTLSNRALPEMIEHVDHLSQEDYFGSNEGASKIGFLHNRIEEFKDDYNSYSWLSWNLDDYRVYQFLQTERTIQ